MSEKQEKNLKETIFTMHAEGFDIPEIEKNALVDILNGKRTFKEVYDQYLMRATANHCGIRHENTTAYAHSLQNQRKTSCILTNQELCCKSG